MTTTCMRDSIVGDQWIYKVCQEVPAKRVLDDKGNWNGNILTGPVRLAFTDAIWEKKPQMKSDPNSKLKHSCTVLFPPYTDFSVFWDEFNRIASAEFPNHLANGQWVGLDIPIFNQGMKANYTGYTPGCMAMNVSSDYKPSIVDVRGNPVVDPSKVYPGVWAIVAVNSYASGKGFPKKGPRFGLSSIMLIADDTRLDTGNAPDPKVLYQGVNITPPAIQPAASFGTMPPQQGPQFGVAGVGMIYGQPQPTAPVAPSQGDWMKQFGG